MEGGLAARGSTEAEAQTRLAETLAIVHRLTRDRDTDEEPNPELQPQPERSLTDAQD